MCDFRRQFHLELPAKLQSLPTKKIHIIFGVDVNFHFCNGKWSNTRLGVKELLDFILEIMSFTCNSSTCMPYVKWFEDTDENIQPVTE